MNTHLAAPSPKGLSPGIHSISCGKLEIRVKKEGVKAEDGKTFHDYLSLHKHKSGGFVISHVWFVALPPNAKVGDAPKIVNGFSKATPFKFSAVQGQWTITCTSASVSDKAGSGQTFALTVKGTDVVFDKLLSGNKDQLFRVVRKGQAGVGSEEFEDVCLSSMLNGLV